MLTTSIYCLLLGTNSGIKHCSMLFWCIHSFDPILYQPHEVGITIIPTLQMMKLRLTMVKYLAKGHKANQQ